MEIENPSLDEMGSDSHEAQTKNDDSDKEVIVMNAHGTGDLETDGALGDLISKEMVAEEQKLKKVSEEEELNEIERKKQEFDRLNKEMREKRYQRLLYLLKKSNMYTSYLVQRMQEQRDEQELAEKRKEARRVNKEKKASQEKDENTSIKRQCLRQKNSQENDVKVEKISKDQTESVKRGKKRKAEDNTMEVKKVKLTIDDMKTAIAMSKTNEENNDQENSHTLDPSQEEQKAELIEPRYIDGQLVHENQPQLLTGGVLRKYQVEGADWLRQLYENGVNGILADEMGLGKTIQCIAAIAHLIHYGTTGPFLIVAPLSTVPNWVSEFQRFAPKIPVLLYHGTPPERAAMRHRINQTTLISENRHVKPVVITSYQISMVDRPYIDRLEWNFLVVDEGHRIKNFNCKLVRELKQYNSSHKLLLTGTPLQNNLSELWSLLNFILPEIFEDLDSFETWFDVETLESSDNTEKIIATERKDNILSMLHQILRPFVLRRLKSDVELVIPPKREVFVYAPLTKKQEKFYKMAVDNTIGNLLPRSKKEAEVTVQVSLDEKGRPKRKASSAKVNYSMFLDEANGRDTLSKMEEENDIESWVKSISNYTKEKTKNNKQPEEQMKPKTSELNIKLLNTLVLLRKSCNHPYLLEYPLDPDTGNYLINEELVKSSGKLMLLDRMLPKLIEDGHKVLIFSQMTSMLDILQDYCYLRNLNYSRLDGKMNIMERKEQMDLFNSDPDVCVFLLSTRAGGVGINLTAADTVIIFDSDWNPQADLQAQDRCHRIGQVNPVMVYRFITANTIDHKIVERASAKRKLEKMVISKGEFNQVKAFEGGKIKPINPKELLELLQSKDYDAVVKGQGRQILSNKELAALLDRSPLQAQWEHRLQTLKGDESADNKQNINSDGQDNKREDQGIEGVFKIVSEESGLNGLT